MGLFDNLDALDMRTREIIRKPPFAYRGSKARHLDKILPHLPYRDSYIEPFGGSGAVLLSRAAHGLEVFNDRHSGVTAFYKCLRDPVLYKQLIDWLELTVHSREEFLDCKREWQNSHDPVERAVKWYYLLQFSFACNQRNWGRNTMAGTKHSSRIQRYLPLFPGIHERIRNVQIENADIFQILRDYDSEHAVFYLDPPYYQTHVSYPWELDAKQHVELLDRVFKMKAFVAVSSYPNDLYLNFPWDQVYEWESIKPTPQAFDTNSNRERNIENTKLEPVTEYLLIKH